MARTKQLLVKSFGEACGLRGYDPVACIPGVSAFPEKHQKALIAAAKLFIINEAINEGHQFDWNDWNESKYYPWFDMDSEEAKEKGGSGFRFVGTYCDLGFSTVGSRLCYRTRAAAEHAGKHFTSLYRDLMVI